MRRAGEDDTRPDGRGAQLTAAASAAGPGVRRAETPTPRATPAMPRWTVRVGCSSCAAGPRPALPGGRAHGVRADEDGGSAAGRLQMHVAKPSGRERWRWWPSWRETGSGYSNPPRRSVPSPPPRSSGSEVPVYSIGRFRRPRHVVAQPVVGGAAAAAPRSTTWLPSTSRSPRRGRLRTLLVRCPGDGRESPMRQRRASRVRIRPLVSCSARRGAVGSARASAVA